MNESSAGLACRCVECFRDFPASEVIRLGEMPVCAECKPAAVAKLTSGKPLGSFWRKGRLLVVVRGEEKFDLPARCVHCNTPAEEYWIDREFSTLGKWKIPLGLLAWGIVLVPAVLSVLPPLRGMAAFAGVAAVFLWLVTLIAAMAAGQRTRWRYGMCRRHWHRHWMQLGIIVGSAVFGAVLGILGGKFGAIVGLIGLALIFVSLGVAMTGQREVRATKHTEWHSYFRGCSPAFLQELPEWPGER